MFRFNLGIRKTTAMTRHTAHQDRLFAFENLIVCSMFTALATFTTPPAWGGGFRVQCPDTTSLHPTGGPSSSYGGPQQFAFKFNPDVGGQQSIDTVSHGGAIKCQQVSGGDGFATMGDGTQIYLFSFGPLSGLKDIVNGLPGTQLAADFNQMAGPDFQPNPLLNIAEPNPATSFNGAVGLAPDPENPNAPPNGHLDERVVMDVGVMNGSAPAPTIAIDEDDELFLTLTNVGMIMRPDLFEQHTIHFHGYPNASSFYDGVPDASSAINIAGSFTYYYLAPDAGTYFWHCHITPPEHLQMGMEGNLYVRPRQNRIPAGNSLRDALVAQQNDPRTACYSSTATGYDQSKPEILCSAPLPPANNITHTSDKSGAPTKYAYNDGDGSTAYDVEYPVQIMGFDPNFHFVGMTFNPESFVDLKDKYFLLNGRSYPDTVHGATESNGFVSTPMSTQSTDGTLHYSQPVPTVINIPAGGKALLRLSMLGITEYQTLASQGIPMTVIANNARLLRDLDGNNLYYHTNSVTMGGGESMDVILDASDPAYQAGQTFYLYTPNLDHLSNDAENFGGLMTEVHICNSVDINTKACG